MTSITCLKELFLKNHILQLLSGLQPQLENSVFSMQLRIQQHGGPAVFTVQCLLCNKELEHSWIWVLARVLEPVPCGLRGITVLTSMFYGWSYHSFIFFPISNFCINQNCFIIFIGLIINFNLTIFLETKAYFYSFYISQFCVLYNFFKKTTAYRV